MSLPPQPSTPTPALQAELTAFVEGMSALCGVDFTRYQRSALLRRLMPRLDLEATGTLGALLDKARADRECLARLQGDMTLHVTSLFRDATFFQLVRRQIGLLATYPSPRLWVAACASGEELYSYQILLREAGLADRCRVYATDLSATVLARAQQGLIAPYQLADHETAYQQAGGQKHLLDYCQLEDGQLRFHPGLLDGVVFSVHNLLTDGSFNEFQFISCRNVTMYFDELGQEQAHRLLHQSLTPLGHLGLGIGESLRYSPHRADYRQLGRGEPLFQRIR
ncbi:MAG TPA: protein-glutamate O-methyltransferase CheR [Candidatus Aquabacterium excrementipullorum]|nr:protein-glutamate O-methyltransferase CheR [Candidatus Aquabacterium excrementipullorum]